MSDAHREWAEERIGRVIGGKWRLERVLGVGGFAAVYAAVHATIGGRIAIKILHRDIALTKRHVDRLILEAKAANRVGAGTVPVIDTGTAEGGEAFFVMELLDGETLDARRIRLGGRMDVEEVLSIAERVLGVLGAAHRKDIIHRDIKPENLFLTSQGEVKVLDFGLARCRELSTASDETSTGTELGTAPFMAPEHAKGEWAQVDARSDLWSVGATMFRLLTGEHVHGALSRPMRWVAAMTRRARPIGAVLPELPEEVAAVVDRALAFEKGERWASALAMQEAMRDAHGALRARALPMAGAERANAKDGSVLLYVPGGVFTMGADDITDFERPIHDVRLSPFWIAKHPVSNAQYAAFLREQPGRAKPALWDDATFNTPAQPVVGMTWEDAAAYAAWAGLALPTEAQWEAAARGTDRRRYPWGNTRPDKTRANYGGAIGHTTRVGAYPAGGGPYGTLDQAGNVWEWCLDPWDSGAYAKRVATGQIVLDPVNAGDTAVRAVRGGSWFDFPGDLAAAFRVGFRSGDRYRILGFRCALWPSLPSTVGR